MDRRVTAHQGHSCLHKRDRVNVDDSSSCPRGSEAHGGEWGGKGQVHTCGHWGVELEGMSYSSAE